jgi:hypothetical protein
MTEFTKSGRISSFNCFPSILEERRITVDTATAAHWLSRAPQTLRVWACYGKGPITANRVHGRLAWPVEQLRQLLCGVQHEL